MKIVTYKCEICKTEFTREEAVNEKRVKAVYFTSNSFFEIRELPADSDTHICFLCLEQLKTQLS